MTRYTTATDADREAMLAAVGVSSISDLLAEQIPAALLRQEPLDLPDGRSEQEVYTHLRDLSAANVSAEDEVTFLGAGMYDHYVPSIIDMLLGRSEFLTPYTPYQPEVSQGGLQVMFEYQTAISELTALPVSNASVYEGPSAVAAAAYLGKLHNGRTRIVVSAGAHPHTLATLETYAKGYGSELVVVPLRDGATDADAWAAAIDEATSVAIVQQPNFLGAVEDVAALAAAAKQAGGEKLVTVGAYDPIALGVLAPPGEVGIDVAVGEGQTLGNRLDFGGPSFGFFAARESFLRRMPGRIAGETTDVDGRRGFVLTLQTREQHIRREKATSNICTSQALNALAGVVYLGWLGKDGLPELAELLVQRTHYARTTLAAIDGVELLHEQPVVREFALRLPGIDVPALVDHVQARGYHPGLALGRLLGDEHADGLLVALTEQRTKEQIDRLAELLSEAIAAQRAATRTEVPA
ncbi:aminomethyl-transferring glycine dehydrogenase subunit GcvPA [Patulibacter defluvii]|uniref:aminomethyl-transferring glycine dehydrogenase subunit GcvPA n=1 Tax=Patulibacter defluvii TaxID=3095358 RepID=UPI002A76645F|nr:aminomethyl-transferring glycine dehydrogenase subunit GcvPA [Patulibacter sp. DM4]